MADQHTQEEAQHDAPRKQPISDLSFSNFLKEFMERYPPVRVFPHGSLSTEEADTLSETASLPPCPTLVPSMSNILWNRLFASLYPPYEVEMSSQVSAMRAMWSQQSGKCCLCRHEMWVIVQHQIYTCRDCFCKLWMTRSNLSGQCSEEFAFTSKQIPTLKRTVPMVECLGATLFLRGVAHQYALKTIGQEGITKRLEYRKTKRMKQPLHVEIKDTWALVMALNPAKPLFKSVRCVPAKELSAEASPAECAEKKVLPAKRKGACAAHLKAENGTPPPPTHKRPRIIRGYRYVDPISAQPPPPISLADGTFSPEHSSCLL
ncbi:hypothetical protein Pelo_10598 [Pelomyxa schiedti]|nr:hypothetical protein Pelo_10598 [Pelomyxa schiedti]